MTRVAALCETHNVGIVPHFTGPISTAALVHALGSFSGPVMFEWTLGSGQFSYLPECLTFNDGKLWPNTRPGLGVTLDLKHVTKISEVNDTGTPRPTYFRPDGSQAYW